MKKLSLSILTIAVVIGFLNGCKKGDGDPALSLLSRKARVAGDWKLSSGEGTNTSANKTTTWTIAGGIYSGTSGNNGTYSMTLKTTKDGKFTRVTTYSFGVGTFNISSQVTEDGTWNFNSGSGDLKKKSQLVLQTLTKTQIDTPPGKTATYTYTGLSAPLDVWDIYELKSKEMVLKQKGSTTSPSSSHDDTYTLTQ